MRSLVWMLAITFLPSWLISGDHRTSLTGYWYHAPEEKTIRIVEKDGGLWISGWQGRHKSTFFEWLGKGIYMDRFNNVIEVESNRELFLVKKKRKQILKFLKVEKITTSCKSPFGEEDYHHNERYWEEEIHNEYRPTAEDRINCEGTWKSNDGQTVIMVNTRDGFKARFQNDQRWIDFLQNRQNPNRFEDPKGNTYIFYGDRCEWVSESGYRKIKLYKISSEVRY